MSEPAPTIARSVAEQAMNLDGLDGVLGFQVRLAQQSLHREFTARFQAFDITPVQYSALRLIDKNPGRRQAELAATLGIQQPNLAVRIDTLVNRGLIDRSVDPLDRRANILRLTVTGKRFLAKLQKAHAEHITRLRRVLGDECYEYLTLSLSRLNAATDF